MGPWGLGSSSTKQEACELHAASSDKTPCKHSLGLLYNHISAALCAGWAAHHVAVHLLPLQVSKVLVVYGSQILQRAAAASSSSSNGVLPGGDTAAGTRGGRELYDQRYKGIWVCLQALSRAMSGNYVNFGVFELYNDPALKDALDVALRCSLSIPLHDIISYK